MKKLITTTISIAALVGILIGCTENHNNEATDSSHIPTIEQKTESGSIPTKKPILPETTLSVAPTTSIAPTTTQEVLKVQTPKENNEQKKNNMNSIIPEGWDIFERVKGEPVIVEGDLNKDNISDFATIIQKTLVNQTVSPRSLLIAFGNKDNTYSISIIADKVILKADEGGVWGDPFDSLIINRGSVIVSDYGGSNWRWYNKYRFRYQDNDWFLIGVTMGSYFTGITTIDKADEDDINLLTGDYIQRRTDEKGNTTTKKGNRGKKELIRLKEFNLEKM
ncbi:hypothetical protein [Paenibacillus durus]|uniref:hypothetical protein n=1 Tax=Paenibacillus durus TaxID=44251 RepID=UPI000470B211|nr:hypothetical protein [Paenibacillus durus]